MSNNSSYNNINNSSYNNINNSSSRSRSSNKTKHSPNLLGYASD